MQLLNVRNNLCQALSIPLVRVQHGREGGHWNVRGNFFLENLVLQAVDTQPLCNAITIHIGQHGLNS